MRRPRTLRSRLVSWFFGAILLAIITSALVVGTTRPEGTSGVEAAARNMASRLAAGWDDPDAVRAYVDEVRDVTGFDVRLVRDVRKLPAHVHRVAERGGSFAPAGPERVFVPIVRGRALIGALEMNRFGVRPEAWTWWRLALALLAVVAVLSIMAGRVANLLARPLEQLAHSADRLGGGDLAFRADLTRAPRWVALEVRDVAVSFNRMADRVEAMVRGQRELLGAISHELRSPLGRARVALEIARDRLPEVQAEGRSPAEALNDVDAQLLAIDAILGDLLDVTRTGLADLRKETRDLVDWLRARIADQPTPPAVLLDVAPGARGIAASFDAALLGRAVHNLLVNARAHGHPPERDLEMHVGLDGDRVCVVVRDYGPGFPAGFADRAFEPFVRGNVARTRPTAGAGYGLGLAIVRRIVEAHGGRVFARNVQDGGSHASGGAPSKPSEPDVGADRAGDAAHTGGAAVGGAEVGFDLPLPPWPR
jgi:signal transduction histidine kinase